MANEGGAIVSWVEEAFMSFGKLSGTTRPKKVAEVDMGVPDPFRMGYRELTKDEEDTILKLKTGATALYGMLVGLGESRELSLAKTKLEECVMWAVKSVTG